MNREERSQRKENREKHHHHQQATTTMKTLDTTAFGIRQSLLVVWRKIEGKKSVER